MKIASTLKFSLLLMTAFIILSLSREVKANNDCVVCILTTPGEKTLAELQKFNGSIAEVLEKLVNKGEQVKSLKLALDDAQKQSQKLLELCQKEKRAILNKFKDPNTLKTCKAYVETEPWESYLIKKINYLSFQIVKEKYVEANKYKDAIEARLIRSGKPVAEVNNNPERVRWRDLVKELEREKDRLEKEYKRLNEEIPTKPGDNVEARETFLEKLGIKAGAYKPECFALLDDDTAREVGCKK